MLGDISTSILLSVLTLVVLLVSLSKESSLSYDVSLSNDHSVSSYSSNRMIMVSLSSMLSSMWCFSSSCMVSVQLVSIVTVALLVSLLLRSLLGGIAVHGSSIDTCILLGLSGIASIRCCNGIVLLQSLETISLSAIWFIGASSLRGSSSIEVIVNGVIDSSIMHHASIISAGIVYFVINALGTLCVITSLSSLYMLSGSVSLLNAGSSSSISSLLIVGILVKVYSGPYHIWVGEFYGRLFNSILLLWLSIAPLVSLWVVVTILLGCILSASSTGGVILFIALLSSTLIGSGWSWSEVRFISMLGFSSVINTGLMIVASTLRDVSSVTINMLVYLLSSIGAVTCIALSYCSTSLSVASTVVPINSVTNWYGMHRRDSSLGIMIVVTMISLSGLPPLAGVVPKLMILIGASHSSNTSITIVIALVLLTLLVSSAAYLRIVIKVYSMPSSTSSSINTIESSGTSLIASSVNGMLIMIILLIVFVGMVLPIDFITGTSSAMLASLF